MNKVQISDCVSTYSFNSQPSAGTTVLHIAETGHVSRAILGLSNTYFGLSNAMASATHAACISNFKRERERKIQLNSMILKVLHANIRIL